MERKLICVQCPIGCHLTVTYDGVHEPVVTGNTCKNGEIYGKSEVTDPRRTLTTSVRVKGERSLFRCAARSPFPKRYCRSAWRYCTRQCWKREAKQERWSCPISWILGSTL